MIFLFIFFSFQAVKKLNGDERNAATQTLLKVRKQNAKSHLFSIILNVYVVMTTTTKQAYQTEIDALTRRSKHAEDSFLGLYQSLATCENQPFVCLCIVH
jgi:phage terminase large subunit-like protein